MNSDEIRRRFLLSDTAIRKLKQFRVEKLLDHKSDLGRRNVERPVFLLHALPLSAFGRTPMVDLSVIRKDPLLFQSPDQLPFSIRYNFDGIQARFEVGKSVPRLTQFFRNGCIELVDATLRWEPPFSKTIPAGYIESLVIDFLQQFVKVFRKINIEPPIYIGLSLLNADGYQLEVEPKHRSQNAGAISSSELLFPEVRMDELDQDLRVTMAETFDILWQSFSYEGWPRPHSGSSLSAGNGGL